jgi:hypothetical protein
VDADATVDLTVDADVDAEETMDCSVVETAAVLYGLY